MRLLLVVLWMMCVCEVGFFWNVLMKYDMNGCLLFGMCGLCCL